MWLGLANLMGNKNNNQMKSFEMHRQIDFWGEKDEEIWKNNKQTRQKLKTSIYYFTKNDICMKLYEVEWHSMQLYVIYLMRS